MLKPPPQLLLCAFLLLWSGACAISNPAYCEQDSDCSDSEGCSQIQHVCELQSPDAGPSDPLATIPQQWQGPFMQSTGKGGRQPAECELEGQEELLRLGQAPFAEGRCRCECGDISGSSCEGSRLITWTSSVDSCEVGQCDVFGSSCLGTSIDLVSGQCRDLPPTMGQVLRVSPGTLQGGSCDAPSARAELSPPEFLDQTLLCSPSEGALACAIDGSAKDCRELQAARFEPTLCIAQEGVHECPAGPFSEREIYFGEIDDGRSCDAGSCACDAPSDLDCGGRFFLSSDQQADCSAIVDVLVLEDSPTQAPEFCSDEAQALRYTYVPETSGHACETSGSATLTGAVSEAAPTTLCCLPQG